jgi:iron complex outermembrane recepter protein
MMQAGSEAGRRKPVSDAAANTLNGGSFMKNSVIQCALALATRTGGRGLAAVAASSVLALAPLSAQAQNSATTATETSTQGGTLEEVVVTAEYRAEKLQETPLAITALSGDALAERGIDNLDEVAKAAPNVNLFQANAAYGKTMAASIRGIGQGDFNFASAEQGVGIYVDDVYFANTFGSMFDLLDVDRVEVLRGPQGTLFGKNSIGGAIRLVSKQPTGDDSGYAEVTVGDYSRREVRAGFDVALIKDVLMLRVSGLSKDRNGYVDRIDYACEHPSTAGSLPVQQLGEGNCTLGTEGGVDVKGGRAQLRWVPSDSVQDTVEASVIDDNSEAAAEVMVVADPALSPAMQAFNATSLIPKYGIPYDQRFQTGGTYTNYSTFYDPFTGTSYPAVNTVHEWSTSNVLTWSIIPEVQFKSITAQQGWWGNFSDDQDNSPMGLAWAYNLLDHRQFTQEFQLTGKAFDDKLNWAAGAFYFWGYSLNRGHIDLNFDAGFFPPGPPFNGQPLLGFNQDDPAYTEDKAGFLQGTYAITDQLHLTAGGRYTKENKNYTFNHYNPLIDIPNPVLDLRGVEGRTSYDHVDWKAGLDYQWTSDLMTYVSATTGFRGGGFNPRPFTNLQITSYKPEKLTEYEVGIKSEWLDHRVRANLAAYYGAYRDVIVTSQRLDATGAPFTAPENVGSADITGGEFELDATPLPGLTISYTAGLTNFKWKDLGNNQGCQDLGAAAIPEGTAANYNCISGNPGYGDLNVGMPKWTSSLGAQYEILLGNAGSLTPRADVNYHSPYYNNNYNNYDPDGTGVAVTPAMALLNGRLTWASLNHLWSVAAFCTNCANKYYYQSFLDLRAFGEGQMSAQPGEPREWGITFRRNFGAPVEPQTIVKEVVREVVREVPAPPPPPPPPIPPPPPPPKGDLRLEGVNFATNSADLIPQSGVTLDDVARQLKGYPELVIQVRGYTDSRGSAAHNLDLSQRRAESVMQYLRQHGVTNSMTAKGYGKEDPIADNSTKDGQLTNRRVTLHIESAH